jgi:phenylalanyl-tRNA synthetase beta chain
MTILTLNKKQLEKELGPIDKKMQDKISMFGTPIEEVTETEVSMEIFPNRPDLLSFQGFTRAINAFLKKPEFREYNVNKPEKNYKVIIDKSVKKVRPFTVCGIVKGLKLDNEKIIEIVDLQEKLHKGYGRDRKKVAIGIYPLEAIKLPIKYLAKKPEEIRFQPLESKKEMNGRQILSQHPKGRDYAKLLKDAEMFPIFEDANREILSMPPIINSEKTGKIDEKTREVFVECSGHNLAAQKKVLNMIITTLADMGGKIYQMEVQDSKNELSPGLTPEKLEFTIENINKTLGLALDENQIKSLFMKMGIGYEKDKDQAIAMIPPYRTDILHEIDLAEEIAIAYGYDNFKPEIPNISTIGQEDKTEILKRKISEILIGLELLEISTYHISTKEKQFKKMNIKEFKNQIIEIEESKTENNILRHSLLANSINILSENSDAAYPQKIFELGKVFRHDETKETEIRETEKLCVSLCYEKANFTEIKQILDYLSRILDFKYEIKEIENPTFISGRAGEITINNKPAGIIGEINPTVLKNSKIRMPTASLELEIKNLK